MMTMGCVGNLGAVSTLSAPEAAATIWNSISGLEKFAAGLNQSDYDKLSAWLNGAYAGGYVVDKYDDPSQITRPSQADIYGLVQRFNNGIYNDAELNNAVQNVSRLVDKGFFIRHFAQTVTATAAPLPVSGSSVASDIGKALATAAFAFAPAPRYQFERPQPVVSVQQRALNVVPWILGFAGVSLMGVVIVSFLKRK